jgi:sugar phosphate isomerase/epimerase
MQIGIFARTFARPTLIEVLSAVRAQGLNSVQFNMSCTGLASLPDQINPEVADSIRHEAARQGVTFAAISGTFNMIDPDLEKRKLGLQRLRVLASVCERLGTQVITVCTGSRDPHDMWARHRDNDTKEAWADLSASMEKALNIADEHRVTLAIEPEVSNVVDSARKGRLLLDEMKSSRLKVVMDGANLFHAGELPRMRRILEDAFQLLGDDIVLAHAKDLSRDGAAGREAAGTGLLDYDLYLSLFHAVGFDGPLILHGLDEEQIPSSVAFLQGKLSHLEQRMVS